MRCGSDSDCAALSVRHYPEPGDRIMIDKMVGKTEVALYGLAYSIGVGAAFHQRWRTVH